jgi:hypothetical protein
MEAYLQEHIQCMHRFDLTGKERKTKETDVITQQVYVFKRLKLEIVWDQHNTENNEIWVKRLSLDTIRNNSPNSTVLATVLEVYSLIQSQNTSITTSD